MVSLGGDRRSPGGGGCSFSAESDDVDDDTLLTNILDVGRNPTQTFPAIMWVIVAIQAISIVGLLACLLCVQDIYYLNIFHVVIWAIMFVTCCCLYRYHRNLKYFGYLQFFKRVNIFVLQPFLVLSFGNSILLIYIAVVELFCPHSDYCPVNSKMHRKYYSWIVFLIEIMILFPSSVVYIWLMVKFARSNAVPDIQQDEVFTSSITSHCPVHEIGFREEDYRDDIIERQTDLIRYLKQHNSHLGRKIIKLAEELNQARELTNTVP